MLRTFMYSFACLSVLCVSATTFAQCACSTDASPVQQTYTVYQEAAQAPVAQAPVAQGIIQAIPDAMQPLANPGNTLREQMAPAEYNAAPAYPQQPAYETAPAYTPMTQPQYAQPQVQQNYVQPQAQPQVQQYAAPAPCQGCQQQAYAQQQVYAQPQQQYYYPQQQQQRRGFRLINFNVQTQQAPAGGYGCQNCSKYTVPVPASLLIPLLR